MDHLPLPFEDTAVPFRGKSDGELSKMKFIFSLLNTSELAKVGIFFIKTSLFLRIPIEKMIKKFAFELFVAGENIENAKKTINNLKQSAVSSILDYSSEPMYGGLDYERNYQEIEASIWEAAQNPAISFAVFKFSSLGDLSVFESVSNNKPLQASQRSQLEDIEKRFFSLCQLAAERKVKLLIDAEEVAMQQHADELVLEAMQKYNSLSALIFNTLQLYRKDSVSRLRHWYEMSQSKGFVLGLKLVRGAYLEKERKLALEMGFPSPVFEEKMGTDNAFQQAMAFVVEKSIDVCLGTHNEDSVQWMYQQIALGTIAKEKVHFAQLYGMSDHITYHLAEKGLAVSKYLPYGPVKGIIPYLIRRAEENKSVMGKSSRELTLILKEIKRRKKA